MADFARVGVAIARALGVEEEFRKALEALKEEQAAVLLEHDMVAQAVIEWARRNPEEEVTAAQLCKELSSFEGFTRACHNPVSLGLKLKNLQAEFKSVVRLEILRPSPTHPARYVFWPTTSPASPFLKKLIEEKGRDGERLSGEEVIEGGS